MKYALVSLAAVSAAALGASGASAQHYSAQSYGYQTSSMTYEQCVRQQQNRQVAGAVVGGLLGAVVGAQVHNATEPRHSAPPPRYGHRGGYHGGYHRGHHGGYHGGYHQPQSSHRSNSGAVIAGGAIGALAGAAVTGNTDCNRYPRQRGGYGGYQHQGYGHQQVYSRQGYGYDGYGYDGFAGQHQGYGYDGYAGGSGGLLGGEDHVYAPPSQARVTVAGGGYYAPQGGGDCRYMAAGNGAQVLMCQGGDGVWRPAY